MLSVCCLLTLALLMDLVVRRSNEEEPILVERRLSPLMLNYLLNLLRLELRSLLELLILLS